MLKPTMKDEWNQSSSCPLSTTFEGAQARRDEPKPHPSTMPDWALAALRCGGSVTTRRQHHGHPVDGHRNAALGRGKGVDEDRLL
jgi:hypothetical protein